MRKSFLGHIWPWFSDPISICIDSAVHDVILNTQSLTLYFQILGRAGESNICELPYFVISVFYHTDKKVKKIPHISEHWGSGAKSYMRKGFLIYEKMLKFFPPEEAVSHTYMTLHPILLNFLIRIWGKFCFLFYQCSSGVPLLLSL